MSPVERVMCVLEGRRADRPPVCFWRHFSADEVWGEAAVAAHVAHLEKYGLDFLKVMNDNPYPHEKMIGGVRELDELGELRGDEGGFGRQLELVGRLREKVGGKVLMTTTVFNAWAVLRHLVRRPTKHNPPEMDGWGDEPSGRIRAWMAEDEGAVKRAMDRIGAGLEGFARRCIEAGADGVFLSVRDDWVDGPSQRGVYERVVRASDLGILRGAVRGRFNMLHVCGRAVDFRAFAEYPVDAINWADRAAGPTVEEARGWVRPAICGGVDNLSTLVKGSEADVEREVADALRQAGGRPMMVTPGCTYDPERVPRENLEAMVRAAAGLGGAGM